MSTRHRQINLQPKPNTPASQPQAPGFALFALGFRPFYLLAALVAAASVPVWLLEYLGVVPAPGPIAGIAWHMHEMVFGFAVAVITGFLFTAGRNWTGQPTPTGAPLAGLAALWIAARVLLVTGPGPVAAAVDLAFLPLVAWSFWKPLKAAQNRRNYFFVGLLAALALLNLCFYLAVFGVAPLAPVTPIRAALYVVVLMVAIMGGRVIPMFTQNAVPSARVRRSIGLDRWALGALAAALALDVLDASGWVVAPVAAAAAVLHAVRLARWDPAATVGRPIVWILHASYAWIPLGLALIAASALVPGLPRLVALHALAIGAVGGMIVGMITRTALGHTGRPLTAGLAERFAYVLVQFAALVRVFGGLLLPALYRETLLVSAALWAAAFAVYLVAYTPILTFARVDGKPG